MNDDDDDAAPPDAVWWLAIAMIYGPVALTTSAWLWWHDAVMLGNPRNVGIGLLIGAALGVAVSSVRAVGPFRELEHGLTEVFAGITLPTVFGLALASAVAEELVFRGLLLPWWGVVASAALFAVSHVPHKRSMWVWPLFAFGMGLLFGELTVRTGDLGAAMGAHFALNLISLHRLVAPD